MNARITTSLLALLLATPARAEQTLHVGPPSLGNGGTNPVSIPPVSLAEYEYEYVTDADTEFNVGIVPGLLVGKRSRTSVAYVGFGGGLVLNANGGGPGVYSAFGVNWGMFNVEFKQALGWDFSNNALISPYAVRLGITWGGR